MRFETRIVRCATAVITLASACMSFAENARTDAMGGISIVNDFSHVLYNPASVNDFPDQLKGSAGTYDDSTGLTQSYFGPILGKISLGKRCAIGFIANTVNTQGSSVLRGNFYTQARSFYLQNTRDSLPAYFPMIPHLLLGMDFKGVGLGIEGFYEGAHYGRSVTSSNAHRDEGIYNYGAKLSADIAVNNVWLCPLVGWGNPFIKGEIQDSLFKTYASDKGAYLTAGMEMGIDLTTTTLVAGAYGSREAFSFRTGQLVSPAYSSVFYDVYCGFIMYPIEGFLVAAEYDVTLEFDGETDTSALSAYDYHGFYQYHAFHAGVERPFKTGGLVDSLTPRAGISYAFSTLRSQLADTVTDYPLYSYGMQLNAGIGIVKDIFRLDLFVNIGNWNGVLTGPRAAAVTLTVGLSKNFPEK